MPCSSKFSKTLQTEIFSTEISDFLKQIIFLKSFNLGLYISRSCLSCGVRDVSRKRIWVCGGYAIINTRILWLSRDNLSSPLFALVIYRHVKNRFTHLLDRIQTTSCSDSKHFFLIFMNQKFQYMIFTLANDHFIV